MSRDSQSIPMWVWVVGALLLVLLIGFIVYKYFWDAIKSSFSAVESVKAGADSIILGAGDSLESIGDLLQVTSPIFIKEQVKKLISQPFEGPQGLVMLDSGMKLITAIGRNASRVVRYPTGKNWELTGPAGMGEQYRDWFDVFWYSGDGSYWGVNDAVIWMSPTGAAAITELLSNPPFMELASDGTRRSYCNPHTSPWLALGRPYVHAGLKAHNWGYRLNRVFIRLFAAHGIAVRQGIAGIQMQAGAFPYKGIKGPQLWPSVKAYLRTISPSGPYLEIPASSGRDFGYPYWAPTPLDYDSIGNGVYGIFNAPSSKGDDLEIWYEEVLKALPPGRWRGAIDSGIPMPGERCYRVGSMF